MRKFLDKGLATFGGAQLFGRGARPVPRDARQQKANNDQTAVILFVFVLRSGMNTVTVCTGHDPTVQSRPRCEGATEGSIGLRMQVIPQHCQKVHTILL